VYRGGSELWANYLLALERRKEAAARLAAEYERLASQWPDVLRPPLPPAPEAVGDAAFEALDAPARSALVQEMDAACERIDGLAERLRGSIDGPQTPPVDDPFGMLPKPERSAPVLPLSAPPRRVPRSYLALEFLRCGVFGSRHVDSGLITVLVGVFVIPTVASAPSVVAAVASAWLLFAVIVASVKTWRRARLLEWGVATVARVHSSESNSTRYKNWGVPSSKGWRVEDGNYSGGGHDVELAYQDVTGATHTLTYSGRTYDGGVILYDARVPARAMRIELFLSQPHPDANGEWWAARPSPISGWRRLPFALSLCLLVGLVAATAYGLVLVVL